MKIRTILTLKYSGITAAVFLVFITTIYYVSEHSRSNSFYRNLRSEAVTKAHLFLNNKVDAQTMQSIYTNNRQFIDEVEVAIYSTDFNMVYHDARQNDIIKETPEMIKQVIREKEINFYVGGYQCVGILYNFMGRDYVVTAAAFDGYGYDNQATLETLLIILLICGLSIVYFIGYLLAGNALIPIRNIAREAGEITASNFHKRLPVNNENDELGELSLTFNALLDRLESSFNAQKMFVSNVSHELRTPLAALTAELDLALQKERSTTQYQRSVSNALNDAHRIIKLTDGLLNLARADYQPERISMDEIRLDELLLDARELVLRANPGYHVEMIFGEESDDDNVLTVVGNSYLLTTAFVNLIENNCKYSQNNTSFIQISFIDNCTMVLLSDNGVGMTETDKENLFTLFYRGDNEDVARGHGIGMTLTKKITSLHKGEISVYSHKGEGTTFLVKLPHI